MVRALIVFLLSVGAVLGISIEQYMGREPLREKEEREEDVRFPTITIDGEVALRDLIPILSEKGVFLEVEPGIDVNKALLLTVSDMPIDRFLYYLGNILDVWVEFDGERARFFRKKECVFDTEFLASLNFSLGVTGTGGRGGAATGGGGGATGGGTTVSGRGGTAGSAFQYTIEEKVSDLPNLAGVLVWQDRNLGFAVLSLSPSEYRKFRKVFEQVEKRTGEMVHVRVDLVRVDLNRKFRWGIDWSSLAKNLKISAKDVADFGAGGTIALAGKQVRLLFSALEEYGRVYKVDTWDFVGRTGKLLSFNNYKVDRYANIITTASQGTVLTQPEERSVEVGFRGALKVIPSGGKYYVEGVIDISDVVDYYVFRQNGIEVQYPKTEGKKVRISVVSRKLPSTYLIGGFRILQKESDDRGVPLLSRIPLLGYLFKGVERSGGNSEFAFIITIDRYRSGYEEKYRSRVKDLGDVLKMPYDRAGKRLGIKEKEEKAIMREAVEDDYFD